MQSIYTRSYLSIYSGLDVNFVEIPTNYEDSVFEMCKLELGICSGTSIAVSCESMKLCFLGSWRRCTFSRDERCAGKLLRLPNADSAVSRAEEEYNDA